MYSELRSRLEELKSRIDALGETLRVDEGTQRLRALEAKMAEPGFWEAKAKAEEVFAEVRRIKVDVEPFGALRQRLADMIELAALGEEEDDLGTLEDLRKEAASVEAGVEELELKSMLSEPYDPSNAYFSIHAGAGGTESCDWAAMLARMYTRFCEERGYNVEMVDAVDGEQAGLRNITYRIEGPYAYGFLKSENGVHRLVRISPFDAKSRRQTSFAAVDVMPELPDTSKDIEINPADLKVDTFRSGGAGGQHVNKVESAVRITHVPTGLITQCQNERSQHANRATAMRMLKALLVREEEKKREAEFEKHYGEKTENAFGSQIRSYTLQPFTLVKDHRTGLEVGNANGVLDGNVMPFIEEYLRWRRRRLSPGGTSGKERKGPAREGGGANRDGGPSGKDDGGPSRDGDDSKRGDRS